MADSIFNLFKNKGAVVKPEEDDEEQKGDDEKAEAPEEQLSFDNMTDWIKSTWVLNEEGEEEKLTLSELFKQFVGKITDGADVKFVAAELPNFLQKFIQSAQFSEEDWKKTVGDCVMELENYVTDAKYLLHLIITSFIIPVTQTNSLVKLSDVEWIDEETSFDVWPQYAIIASVLDDAIKKKGNGAVSEIISSL